MYRRFIAIVISAAVAVTGLNVSTAQAGNDDLAKWIAGAAALAIVGAAVADRNKNRSQPRYNSGHVHTPNYGYSHGKGYGKGRGKSHGKGHGHGWSNHGHSGHGVTPRPNPLLLPARCHMETRINRKPIRGFSRHCLKQNRVNVAALPQNCAVKFRDRRSDRPVVLYTGQCLNQYGYQISRR